MNIPAFISLDDINMINLDCIKQISIKDTTTTPHTEFEGNLIVVITTDNTVIPVAFRSKEVRDAFYKRLFSFICINNSR